MQNISTKVRWLIGLLVLLGLITTGIYFFSQYNKGTKNPSLPGFTPPSAQDSKDLGLTAAQKLFTDYPQFIKKTIIQQQIEGTLKVMDKNSWTIEAEGKTLTLANQSTNKIRYIKIPKTATGSAKVLVPVEIKAEDLKIGDLVSITQIIDWQTGKVTITGITVLSSR